MVGLVNTPLILLAPADDWPPVIPPVTTGTDQLYSVPTGTMPLVPLVGVTLKITPLHVTVVIAVITAVGFNVTVTVKLAFTPQLSVVGVTV